MLSFQFKKYKLCCIFVPRDFKLTKKRKTTKQFEHQTESITLLTEQISQLKTKFENLKTSNNSIVIADCSSTKLSSIIPEYLNTILLILIIIFQIISTIIFISTITQYYFKSKNFTPSSAPP